MESIASMAMVRFTILTVRINFKNVKTWAEKNAKNSLKLKVGSWSLKLKQALNF